MARWNKNWSLTSLFFSGEEISVINERLKSLMVINVVFCSFENRFAKSGGLASVISNILPYVKESADVPVVTLLSPFYQNLMRSKKLKSTGITFEVPFGRRKISAEIIQYTHHYASPCNGSLTEFYIHAETFFEARNNMRDPYIYFENDHEASIDSLRENALFFCRAVPFALKALDLRRDTVLHLHEWQTALTALTVKDAMINGTIESCGTIQTMHNSYDTSLQPGDIEKLLDSSRKLKISGLRERHLSIYQVGLQVTDAPASTVSEHFASELTSDILQTEYYAPHLQSIFRTNSIQGVNNGMFVDFSEDFPGRDKHTIEEIRTIKLKNRKALLRILSAYKPKERFGDITFQGKTILKLPDEVPIIVMTGRLDPTQKGYYVILRALEKFAVDEIKAVLAPMPVHPDDLDYFYEVACKCRGNITVYPLRMERGYNELQTGATFGVMPSIYEPFGAAIEYMAKGTVNIGRSTGGLVDQIDEQCGFLYKEDAIFYTLDNISEFIETSDIVQARKTNPWAESMANNLYEVLRKAASVYSNKPDRYYTMIQKGFKKAGEFTWDNAAKKYANLYRMISSS